MKPCGLWSRPGCPAINLPTGVRPNSPAQTTKVSVEQSATIEVFNQRRRRLVRLRGARRQIAFDVAVMVPVVSGRDLDAPHAGFGHPSGQPALPREDVGGLLIDAVTSCVSAVSASISNNVRRDRLHTKSQLIRLDHAVEWRIVADARGMQTTQCRDRVDLFLCHSAVSRSLRKFGICGGLLDDRAS